MSQEEEFRDPSSGERALLDRLLQADFPGKAQLVKMVRTVAVRTLDREGSLELQVGVGERASVVQRIPVEAQGKDINGMAIFVLLHVVDGRPHELEIFREDGSPVKRMPPPSSFEVIVLPPPPTNT